jgi:hypothetical protein
VPWLSKTANDDFHLASGFDLEPVATALLNIRTRQALRDDSFERYLAHFLIECFAVLDYVIGITNVGARFDDRL